MTCGVVLYLTFMYLQVRRLLNIKKFSITNSKSFIISKSTSNLRKIDVRNTRTLLSTARLAVAGLKNRNHRSFNKQVSNWQICIIQFDSLCFDLARQAARCFTSNFWNKAYLLKTLLIFFFVLWKLFTVHNFCRMLVRCY